MKTPFLLSFVALVFAGCATPKKAPPVALGPPEKSVTLTARERGQFVSLLPNGTVTVNLDANARAGYRWKLAAPVNPAVLQVVVGGENKLPAIVLPPEGPTTPEPQQWVFKSVGPGTEKIRLIYSRPNQPLNDSATYDFTVNAE